MGGPNDPLDTNNWSFREVCEWAKNNDLPEFVEPLKRKKLTGKQLIGIVDATMALFVCLIVRLQL